MTNVPPAPAGPLLISDLDVLEHIEPDLAVEARRAQPAAGNRTGNRG